MRVVVFVKSTADAEKGTDFTDPKVLKMMEDMGKYNEELKKAGIMVTGAGLQPATAGKRVAFNGPDRKVVDVSYKDPGELVAGFWIWDVKDMNEAVEWVKKCPNPMFGPSEIEIRPFYEFGDPQ
jgi:hypothetical protein